LQVTPGHGSVAVRSVDYPTEPVSMVGHAGQEPSHTRSRQTPTVQTPVTCANVAVQRRTTRQTVLQPVALRDPVQHGPIYLSALNPSGQAQTLPGCLRGQSASSAMVRANRQRYGRSRQQLP
jgi:hypothetical protein